MLEKKKYKHEITEELFLEALTANDGDFTKKRDYYKKYGIFRTNGSEIRKEMPYLLWYGISNERVTFIYDAEIKRNPDKDALIISNLNNPELNSLLLYNCYSDSIYFTNCNLAKKYEQRLAGFNIYLIETIIEGLLFDNSYLGNFNSRGFKTNKLAIGNSNFWDFKINKSHIISCAFGQSMSWDVRIDYGSDIDRLYIKETKLNGFYFRKSKANDINIFLKSNLKACYVQSSKVEEFSLQNQSTAENISIGFGSEIGEIYLGHNIEVNSLGISDSEIEKIELRKKVYTTSISFRNSILNFFKADNLSCRFYFYNVKGIKTKIIRCNVLKLTIKDCENDFYIEESEINLLELTKSSLPATNVISISNVKLFFVLIEELSVMGKLFFIKISALENPITNGKPENGKEQSSNTSIFRIVNSSLGETEFIDSDLDSFDSFEFCNSRITQVFLIGGRLPEQNISIYGTEKRSEKWYEQMVTLFNQFSSIFQAQGHIYQAIDFRSKSSEYQLELLRKKRAWLDLIPFKLNAWSNQHGASWTKALWFLIWTTIVFYLLALLTTGNLFKFDNTFEPAFIGYFFDFLNPLRSFDFYSGIGLTINGWTRFIDLLSRVVIGYGIYQLISAFRRYGRK